jgi:hypothetical protein
MRIAPSVFLFHFCPLDMSPEKFSAVRTKTVLGNELAVSVPPDFFCREVDLGLRVIADLLKASPRRVFLVVPTLPLAHRLLARGPLRRAAGEL